MKLNWGKLKKRLATGDLFDRTRNRLTFQYSGVLIVFLSLFVVIIYTLLYAFIWNDQHNRLKSLADSEITNLQNWADQDPDPTRPPPRSVEDTFSLSADQSFYYLVSTKGTIQLGDEIQPELRDQMMAFITAGRIQPKKIDRVALQTFSKPSLQGETTSPSGEDAQFIVTSRTLQFRGKTIATLYIGKDVTFQRDLFRWLFILLFGMALAFFVLSTWFSYLMSRKAMIPIANAYAKQREFVADASHELRTPLSVMLASIEALQLEESPEHADPFPRKVLAGLKDEVNSMSRLAESLLDLARTDSDESRVEKTLFDAKTAADAVIDKLRPMAQAKEILLALHAPTELPVKGDAEKFTQLLVLLIDNAVKYTPKLGFVQVTLAEEKDNGIRTLVLEVKDSGIGIPAEALPRIFDRFYRQDKSRTRQNGGHGLGLAIARNIVYRHRGSIHVDSKPGKGSTFRVRLPWL